ncbi:MAG: peptidylprolyl isomerase [bacterium]|nr:peptidylprolyl isomerase [bacterium]
MQIAAKSVVAIDYTLKDEGGEVLDTSDGDQPLEYLHGVGLLVPGLEEALEGKESGHELQVNIPPEKGYGERDDRLLQNVPKAQLPVEAELEVGMQFQAQSEDGIHVVTVMSIEGDQVLLDGNHPLAGMTLDFEVKVVNVREATEEELEHGHVHGPGGHEH